MLFPSCIYAFVYVSVEHGSLPALCAPCAAEASTRSLQPGPRPRKVLKQNCSLSVFSFSFSCEAWDGGLAAGPSLSSRGGSAADGPARAPAHVGRGAAGSALGWALRLGRVGPGGCSASLRMQVQAESRVQKLGAVTHCQHLGENRDTGVGVEESLEASHCSRKSPSSRLSHRLFLLCLGLTSS